MQKIRTLSVLLGTLLVANCNTLEVTDLNNPSLGGLQDSPTRSGVIAAATGLLIGTRSGIAAQNGYISLLGIIGRESYNFDPADPRFVTEMLIGPLDGGSPAFGGNLFLSPYANIRNANIVLHATDNVVGVTDTEKESIRGFAQTIQALDFLNVINTRDENGAPVDVDIDPTADPAAIKTKAEVFTRIINLLDSGMVHLQAGGAAFPFPLSSGFTGFNTPATFLQFNRALRARVAVYTQDYAGALTALEPVLREHCVTAVAGRLSCVQHRVRRFDQPTLRSPSESTVCSPVDQDGRSAPGGSQSGPSVSAEVDHACCPEDGAGNHDGPRLQHLQEQRGPRADHSQRGVDSPARGGQSGVGRHH